GACDDQGLTLVDRCRDDLWLSQHGRLRASGDKLCGRASDRGRSGRVRQDHRLRICLLGVVLVERKGERLEVVDISDSEEAIDPDTERMRGELGVEVRGEAAKAMGMVSFDVQLERELAVDGLDELAQMRVQVAKRRRGTGALVAAWHGHEVDVALRAQVGSDGLADV